MGSFPFFSLVFGRTCCRTSAGRPQDPSRTALSLFLFLRVELLTTLYALSSRAGSSFSFSPSFPPYAYDPAERNRRSYPSQSPSFPPPNET